MLTSYPAPGPRTNPYITQLDAALRRTPGLEVENFSWRRALTGSFDVFHVHWPHTLSEGRTAPRALVNGVRALLLLLCLKLSGTTIVRTVHNNSSHEAPSRLARLVERCIERRTRVVVRLNEHTRVRHGIAHADIPHGHYREWFAPASAEVVRDPRRVLFFGLIRAYKGVEELIASVSADPTADLELRIVGAPYDAEIAERLRVAASRDGRISCELSYVDDERLAAEIRRSSIVVLPYRVMNNSGAMLLALSLDTPVLVPFSPVTRDLSAEVGEGWVHLFDGAVTASDLTAALAAVADTMAFQPPDLGRRGWETVGAQHLAAYLAALRPGEVSGAGLPAVSHSTAAEVTP